MSRRAKHELMICWAIVAFLVAFAYVSTAYDLGKPKQVNGKCNCILDDDE